MKYPGTIINYPSDKNPQLDWFLDAAKKAQEQLKASGKINPCVKLHGKGPVDKRCKDCKLIFRHLNYFKCELRGFTRGKATDHRANWPACGKFQPL